MISQLLSNPQDLVGLPEHIEESLECGKARCIAFNPTGTLLASGCEEGEVVIWDCCTRGVARIYKGHRSSVAFVGWSGNGRRLVSASLDGHLVLWDVLSGEQLEALDLGSKSAVSHAHLDPANEAQLLVSYAQGPAQFVDLSNKRQDTLPVLVLETKKGAARVVRDPEDPAAATQLAVLSRCGRLVFVATKGVVAVHRRQDLALLDLVVLQNSQYVQTMSHGQSDTGQGWLLMISQDRVVRAYQVEQGAESQQAHDPAELDAVNKPPKAGSSLLRGASPLLVFQRQFQDSLEKRPWSCAAFSSDMEHVVGGMSNKHAIQRWNLYTAMGEGTLEGGKDGVVAMAWHPTPLPMQLYTVGSGGTIYIWTKIERENWDSFAPDFEELEENREYVEREDEFDLNPRPEDQEMAEPSGGAWEEEELDIMGPADEPGGAAAGGEDDSTPLRYLPVTVADLRAAVEREQRRQGAGQQEGGAPPAAVLAEPLVPPQAAPAAAVATLAAAPAVAPAPAAAAAPAAAPAPATAPAPAVAPAPGSEGAPAAPGAAAGKAGEGEGSMQAGESNAPGEAQDGLSDGGGAGKRKRDA